MTQSIDEILDTVINNEGGFVNNPSDAGGPTKYGITQATLSNYLGRDATIDDIKNLSIDDAKEIYQRKYYTEPRFDTLPVDLQPVVVDTGVLYGTRRAVIFIQTVINEAGFGPIDVDGTLGPQTRAAVTKAFNEMQGYFINAIVDERINRAQQIVANNPSQQVFLKGWTNRAESFRVPVN